MMKECVLAISVVLLSAPLLYCDGKMSPDEVSNAGVISIKKIVERNKLEKEGRRLAKQGLYDDALVRFRAATNPALLNDEGEASVALCSIRRVYILQHRFEDALELNEKHILPFNPKKDSYIDASLEILALIKARDTKSNKPIYGYINYIRTKYPQYFPPKGDVVGMTDIFVDDFIHLYDYMRDYDGGIALMDEMIKYYTSRPDPAHRSARANDVREYRRVKQAWELDKKTGKHGHLQEVIRTSDIIGW
jgi:hypothetical protein